MNSHKVLAGYCGKEVDGEDEIGWRNTRQRFGLASNNVTQRDLEPWCLGMERKRHGSLRYPVVNNLGMNG